MIPGCAITVRVNGHTQIIDQDELKQLGIDRDIFDPDENAKILQALRLEVDEIAHITQPETTRIRQ